MFSNGEKWACEACIRGHRSGSCRHQDRPLSRVSQKGRPSTQCGHCRGLRKSRACHTRCECGKESRFNSPGLLEEDTGDSQQRCRCNYGQRCICAYKKEPRDSGAEAGKTDVGSSSSLDPTMPNAMPANSENTAVAFDHGTHIPAYDFSLPVFPSVSSASTNEPPGIESSTNAPGIPANSATSTDLCANTWPSTLTSTHPLDNNAGLRPDNQPSVSFVDGMQQQTMDDPISSLPYISPFDVFDGSSSQGSQSRSAEGNAPIIPNAGYNLWSHPDLFASNQSDEQDSRVR